MLSANSWDVVVKILWWMFLLFTLFIPLLRVAFRREGKSGVKRVMKSFGKKCLVLLIIVVIILVVVYLTARAKRA